MKIRANGIDIEVEDTGNQPPGGDAAPGGAADHGPGHAAGGLAAATGAGLVDAGYRVIRMDNRDIGLSQHFDHLGKPNILWAGLKYKLA
jgi:hypothetical protein